MKDWRTTELIDLRIPALIPDAKLLPDELTDEAVDCEGDLIIELSKGGKGVGSVLLKTTMKLV